MNQSILALINGLLFGEAETAEGIVESQLNESQFNALRVFVYDVAGEEAARVLNDMFGYGDGWYYLTIPLENSDFS